VFRFERLIKDTHPNELPIKTLVPNTLGLYGLAQTRNPKERLVCAGSGKTGGDGNLPNIKPD